MNAPMQDIVAAVVGQVLEALGRPSPAGEAGPLAAPWALLTVRTRPRPLRPCGVCIKAMKLHWPPTGLRSCPRRPRRPCSPAGS